MRVLLILATLGIGTAARAQETAAARDLRATAERIRAAEGDVIVQDSSGTRKVPRAAALADVYRDLAGLEYRKAMADGSQDQQTAAKAELAALAGAAASDAKAIRVDPALLEKSSCQRVCTPTWLGVDSCRSYCTAVAAVRGGRTLGAEDPLMKLEQSLPQAKTPLDSARVYAKMAQASETPAAGAAQPLTPKQIYQKAGPAVVLIIGADKDGVGELGTGSIIDAQGRVLTNAHVVIRDSTGKPYSTLRVYLKPERVSGDPKRDLRDPVIARVARSDRELDLALLEPEQPLATPARLALGDADELEPGDPVVAIGHPEQGGLWTLTSGVVSTVVADLGGVPGKDVIQTDASINRGNSGGPLLDRSGAQVGVNTSMARKAADGLTITSVNFSVKSNVVRRWLEADRGLASAAPADAPKAPAAPETQADPLPKAEGVVAKSAPAAKAVILTPAKPFRAEDVLRQEIGEMEDLEREMKGEIEKRRGQLERR